MTFRVKRPSRRSVRNMNAFYAGETVMEAPVKRGKQPEGETNKAVAHWRKLKQNLLLERNRRRLATPVGSQTPIMLGWGEDGSPDWCGYLVVTVTPAMLSKRVAIFVGLEAKRPDGTGVVSGEQEAFLNALTDAGGIAGVVCNADDCEAAIVRWTKKMVGDER